MTDYSRAFLLEGLLLMYDDIERLEKSRDSYKALGAEENAQILSAVIDEMNRLSKKLEHLVN